MTGWTAVLTGIGLTAATAAWAIRWSGSRARSPRPTGAAHPGRTSGSDPVRPVTREAG